MIEPRVTDETVPLYIAMSAAAPGIVKKDIVRGSP